MQNQDLVLANRLLAREGAALFAALSMVGGIAAFATSTIPLVLLPRATAPPSPASRAALYVALAVAAALGGLAAAAGVLAPPGVFAGLLGTCWRWRCSASPASWWRTSARPVARG